MIRVKGEIRTPPLGQGFRTAWLVAVQKFPWNNLKSGSPLLTFWDPSSHICEIILWMAKSGNMDPDKTGFFQTHVLRVFEKWDPGIFQKSQISKISCSSHSKNDHIKLNLDSWCRAEKCGPPFIFYGLDVEIRPKLTPPSCLSTWVGC